ncbi:putative L-type lectin-domain containing receptor kinase S.7 [Silene latifolia]|uniref:putative L-type lectin-domain containing receptor kinase S.7 n=1 Tax=Silene latifolia TaxID=37657 RepID=UPI003D784A48
MNSSSSSSSIIIIIIIFLVSILTTTSASNIKFHYTSMNPRNFTLLGDSYLKNGVAGLTREVTVPTTSSGSIIYNTPILFFDSDSNITSSFSTNFSFIISNLNPNASRGDGFSFFLSSNNHILGSPGGYLGLVNSSDLTQNRFLALEFDTKLDAHFQDPNDNHVGFDVNSLISIRTVTLGGLKGIDLRNGSLTYVWIDYKNEDKILKVFMNYSTPKPNKPVLDLQLDLSEYLKEFMYVGFSGSTEGSTELHLIHSFGFETHGFMPLRPHFRTHNVSDTSVIGVTPPVLKSRSKNHWKRIGFGLGVAGLGLFCILVIVFGYTSVNNKRKEMKKQKSFKAEMVTGPRQFSYRELKIATKDFHHSRILGHGAFGTVYKAVFTASGNVAAVKRSKHTHDGKTEFLAELSIIACLRHKNLVQLQGWCAEKGELLLVYDFMPNGSLDNVLYSETQIDENPLPWAQRYNITVGLASVLTYLHQECEQVVIHRDIKSSNVMLDANYNPKLGDFGLARLMEHDKSPVSTLTAGTMGYLAPEYLQYGKATEKTDVFSYGVVVLEVACGRRPIERETEEEKRVNLVDWAWGLHSQGKVLDCGDDKLKGEFNENEMKKLVLVGLSCVNPDSTKRPNMRRVLQILKNEASPVVVPLLKPTMIFSNSLPLSIEDIVSDDEDTPGSDDLFQITVDPSHNLKQMC